MLINQLQKLTLSNSHKFPMPPLRNHIKWNHNQERNQQKIAPKCDIIFAGVPQKEMQFDRL